MQSLKRFARSAMNHLNIHTIRHHDRLANSDVQAYEHVEARRAKIMDINKIDVVLDVGANTGQYAITIRKNGYRGKIISFEPLPEAFNILEANRKNDDKWEAKNVALGPRDGKCDIHVAGNSMSSSFLEMSSYHEAVYPDSAYTGDQNVTMARLDSLSSTLFKPGQGVYLKMDVQGYEMDVLKGGTQALSEVAVVEAEMCLTQLYEGQPLPFNLMAYLSELGYDLYSLDNGGVDASTGRVLWVDGIFVRSA
jgi:FkbM family methyltransferase